MRNLAWLRLAPLAAVTLLISACESTTPAPEVKITFFNPLGWYTNAYDTTRIAGPVEEVDFQCYNYVDAVIKNVSYTVLNKADHSIIFPERPLLELSLFVSGEAGAITKLYGVGAPLAEIRDYMDLNNVASTYIRFVFTGEDAFGYEKEFADSIDFGIHWVP